jgi:hypothetical protein
VIPATSTSMSANCRTLFLLQVMETKNMIYIVSEYASQGEIFGEYTTNSYILYVQMFYPAPHEANILNLPNPSGRIRPWGLLSL